MSHKFSTLAALLFISCTAPSTVPTAPSTSTPVADQTARGTPQPASAAPSAAVPTWSRIADIPTPRSEVAAASFGDAVYVMGGSGGPRAVERYDTRANRWDRAPDLPIGVDHPMAASIASGPRAGIYLMGGYADGPPTARAFHLAPGASGWRELARMPEARAAAAAVAIGDRIYVVGGATQSGLAGATLEYDPAADRWTSRAGIPTHRDHLAAAVLDGRACAVGGRELSLTRNLPTFECYDPARDTWERMPAAPTARGGVGAAVVGTQLAFVGGERPEGTFAEVEIYDGATRQWSRGPDLPTPRHGIGVVAVGGSVYVMSGGPTPGGSQTAVCEVLALR